jgi:hypothetical protein
MYLGIPLKIYLIQSAMQPVFPGTIYGSEHQGCHPGRAWGGSDLTSTLSALTHLVRGDSELPTSFMVKTGTLVSHQRVSISLFIKVESSSLFTLAQVLIPNSALY